MLRIARVPALRPGSRVLARQFSLDTVAELILPLRSSLEVVKEFTGLSWPVFIPLATIAVRAVATAPLAVYARVCLRRQNALQPVLRAALPVYRAQLAQTAVQGKSQLTPNQISVLAFKERNKMRKRLFKEFVCQNWRMLLLPAVQIPVFVGMTLAVRSLALYDLSAITEFGNLDASRFLWFRNLVEPDSYGVFPLAIGACALANVELNAANSTTWAENKVNKDVQSLNAMRDTSQAGPSVRAFLRNTARAGAIVFMAMSFQAPAALQLYWFASNLFSFIQNLLLNIYLPAQKVISYPNLSTKVFETENDNVKSQKE